MNYFSARTFHGITFEEWRLAEHVTDEEFFARYTPEAIGVGDMAFGEQGRAGEGLGNSEPGLAGAGSKTSEHLEGVAQT